MRTKYLAKIKALWFAWALVRMPSDLPKHCFIANNAVPRCRDPSRDPTCTCILVSVERALRPLVRLSRIFRHTKNFTRHHPKCSRCSRARLQWWRCSGCWQTPQKLKNNMLPRVAQSEFREASRFTSITMDSRVCVNSQLPLIWEHFLI